MEKRLIKRRILGSDKIQEINEATIVMRHFIELSAKLLPYLNDLTLIEHPSDQEKCDKEKISAVFKSYRFDTSTSKILMNSTILELIKNAYDDLQSYNYINQEHINDSMQLFLKEHERLVQNWIKTDLN